MSKAISFLSVVICFACLAMILDSVGQPIWCILGDSSPWSWDINSPHNSQHFIDAYSFSHILHGFLFVWIFSFFAYSKNIYIALGACVETLWEILENSPIIIQRYRAATISLNYSGDALANSLSDVACCLIGIWIAMRLGFMKSLIVFIAVELVMMYFIRDSLTLNILMLVYPLDAVRSWQSGL